MRRLSEALHYTLTHIEERDKIELKELLTSSVKKEGEGIMTNLIDAWLQDGIKIGEAIGEARGREKNSLEIAKRMLANGLDVESVSSMTGLDKNLIEAAA